MKYTIVIDDLALPRAVYAGADTLAQAKQELRIHLRENPKSTNVVAEVAEPGDQNPRWVLVATARKGIRSIAGATRTPEGMIVLPSVATPEAVSA